MKKRAFKIVLGLLFVFGLFAFVGVFTTNTKVYANEIVDTLGDEEQGTENQEETTESNEEVEQVEEQDQEVTLTEEEKGKLDKVVEWLSNLNKDELMTLLNTAKSWLIAGGIVTVITFLSAVIGLIVAILKLQRQRVINSDKEEKQKQKELEIIENFKELVKKKNDEVKMLLLNLINNATDDEKKAMEANIEDVRTKITKALEESNKTE